MALKPLLYHENDTASVLEELIPGSNRLYFIFGGIHARMGMPPFEFYNSSRILEESKVFFRDFSQSWYQNGLPGIGGNVFEVSEFIERKIEEVGPRELYFVGNSMGGYGAILFASLVGSGTAIAFAPQTFISPLKRLLKGDRRWQRQVNRVYLSTFTKRHVWDLKKWMSRHKRKTKINIFVSKKNRLDCVHARQLQELERVDIYEYPVGGHALVRHLRDEGVLPNILIGNYAHGSASPEGYCMEIHP